MTANTLPVLPGYQWRTPGLADMADVRQLATICAQSDGRTNLHQAADYAQALADVSQATNALCAVTDTRQLVACGWVMLDSKGRGEYHAFLSLSVHPDHRATGVADALLPWLEARAHQVFAAVADGRSLTLRLDAYEEAERDTTARQALLTLYQQHGYQFAMAEDEMRRDLSLPIPAYPLPAGMNWVTWTPEREGLLDTL
jgi:GNAT superfamily N-acetyltransferase